MSQHFTLVGRTTADVELRFTPNGTAIGTVTVACDRYNAKKLKEEGKQATDFFKCVALGKKAEYLANYLKKGKLVEIHGQVNIDVVNKDGMNNYYTKVLCDQVSVLEYANDNQSSGDEYNYNHDDFQAIEEDEDIPFIDGWVGGLVDGR